MPHLKSVLILLSSVHASSLVRPAGCHLGLWQVEVGDEWTGQFVRDVAYSGSSYSVLEPNMRTTDSQRRTALERGCANEVWQKHN